MIVDVPDCGSRFVSKAGYSEGPPMQLTGIPDRVHWQTVADFLTSLGIDLRQVSAQDGDGDNGVVVGWKSIRCTIYAQDANGHRYVDLNTGEVAKHTVHIPIVHDDA